MAIGSLTGVALGSTVEALLHAHGIDIGLSPEEAIGSLCVAGGYTGAYVENRILLREQERRVALIRNYIDFCIQKHHMRADIEPVLQTLDVDRKTGIISLHEYRLRLIRLYQELPDSVKTSFHWNDFERRQRRRRGAVPQSNVSDSDG